MWFFTVTSFFLTFFNGIKTLFLFLVWSFILFVFLLIWRWEVLWWRVLAPGRWLNILLIRMDRRLMMVRWRATKLRININRLFIRRANEFHLNVAFHRSLVLEWYFTWRWHGYNYKTNCQYFLIKAQNHKKWKLTKRIVMNTNIKEIGYRSQCLR